MGIGTELDFQDLDSAECLQAFLSKTFVRLRKCGRLRTPYSKIVFRYQVGMSASVSIDLAYWL